MPIRNILLAVLLLAAAPVSQALAKEEYKDAHIHEPAIPAGMGRVYFYRGGAFFSAGDTPAILIDNAPTGGNATPHHYFYVDSPAGSHTVSVGSGPDQSAALTVVAGQEVYVITTATEGMFSHVVPSVVDTALGRRQINRCVLLAPGGPYDPSAAPTAIYVAPPPPANGNK